MGTQQRNLYNDGQPVGRDSRCQHLHGKPCLDWNSRSVPRELPFSNSRRAPNERGVCRHFVFHFNNAGIRQHRNVYAAIVTIPGHVPDPSLRRGPGITSEWSASADPRALPSMGTPSARLIYCQRIHPNTHRPSPVCKLFGQSVLPHMDNLSAHTQAHG